MRISDWSLDVCSSDLGGRALPAADSCWTTAGGATDGPLSAIGQNRKEAHMPLYEHVFLARQDLAQTQVDGLAEAATKIIEDNGGQVAKVETWGLGNSDYRPRKTQIGRAAGRDRVGQDRR